MSEYPEHEKMAAMRTELDAVASFLEVLDAGKLSWGGQQVRLAVEWEEEDDLQITRHRTMLIGPDIPALLAQWSGIDQNTIEAEKHAMLKKCQEAAAVSPYADREPQGN